MISYVLRIAKVFLYMAIAFGLGMGLFYSTKNGLAQGLVLGVFAGLTFSTIMTIIIIPIDIFKRLMVRRKFGVLCFNYPYRKEVLLNKSRYDLHGLCLNVLRSKTWFRKIIIDDNVKHIKAECGKFGAILIDLRIPTNRNIVITSEPRNKLYFDSGNSVIFAETIYGDLCNNLEVK